LEEYFYTPAESTITWKDLVDSDSVKLHLNKQDATLHSERSQRTRLTVVTVTEFFNESGIDSHRLS